MKILKLNGINKLLVSSKQESYFIPIDNIVCVVAQENYSMLHLHDNTKLLVSQSLKIIEEHLLLLGFVRCHKSYLINITCVDKWMFKGKNAILLSNKMEVLVSRNGVKKLKELITSCG